MREQDLEPMRPIVWPQPVNNAITDCILAGIACFGLGAATCALLMRWLP